MSPLRMSSAAKRDLFVIICCSLVLCLLVDYRYDVSNQVMVHLGSSPPVIPTDEYGDAIKTSHSHSSSSFKGKGKSKHTRPGALTVPPPEFDTKDRPIGRAKLVWGADNVPATTLVKHSPGTYQHS